MDRAPAVRPRKYRRHRVASVAVIGADKRTWLVTWDDGAQIMLSAVYTVSRGSALRNLVSSDEIHGRFTLLLAPRPEELD